MANKFFALMEHDHNLPKNKLQEEFRNRVREDFSQTLVDSPKAESMKLDRLGRFLSSVHSKCKPVEGYFSEESKYGKDPDCYRVDGLFKLSFYPVKEVINV
jgi:hypothetical protein